LVCAVALLGGCSRGDGRVALGGKVTLDGKPLSLSVIRFEPVEESGRGSGAGVEDGQFQIDAEHGLQPGTYQVRIQAYRATGRTYDDPQRGGKTPELVPVPIRAIEPAEITVSSGEPNAFEIKLSTGKPEGSR
jgi:hypothetical protein